MTAIRLALTEIRRLTTSPLGALALVAMILVPSIYGGFYLYANNDPYSNLTNVPAAIVVEDAGTTLSTGERLEVGDRVTDELVASHTFDWRRLDREQAQRELDDGRVDFVLVVPRTFSADLASSADFTPRQATLEIETNDANGYLARTIANNVVEQVTRTVASEVSRTAASELLEGFSTIHAKVAEAASGARELAQGAATAQHGADALASGSDQLVAGEERLVAGTDQLAAGAASLDAGLERMREATAALPTQTRRLADGARQVADGNAKVAAAGQQVADASGRLVSDLTTQRGELADRLLAAGFTQDQVDSVLEVTDELAGPVKDGNAKVQSANADLHRLSSGAAQVADGAGRLAASASELTTGISRVAAGAARLDTGAQQLATGQHEARDGARRLSAGAHELDDGLGRLSSGADRLADGLESGVRSIPNPSADQRKAVAETLGNPVGVAAATEAAAATYGAGLAPFFMSLALWIGGFVLFTRMRPVSTRALAAGQPGWRVALGGWLAPAGLGALQAVLAYGVVHFGVGITVAHPFLLLAFMVAVSGTFLAIIHALSVRFGAVGQFLALVIMVLQLVSAGGTFPWQTLPGPLLPVHHALPMSYAVDGMRRLMYGGSLSLLVLDLLVLGAWAAVAFLAAARAARRAGTWTARRVRPELPAV